MDIPKSIAGAPGTRMTEVQGKRVLVVGLARTGRAAAFYLRRRGAVVTVTDLKPPSAFQDLIPELAAQKIGMELGIQREETFLRQNLIVVSPGVPWDLPALRAAREKAIPVVPEVEVASWYIGARLVGITGTNGKSTTTALLGRILEASGFSTFVGGNIGVPLISAADRVTPDSVVVAELSSYQLEGIESFRPHVAVLLNITSHHMDRHSTFDAYLRAKVQIFRNQRADDFAILNGDDPTVMSLAPNIQSRKILFRRGENLPEGVFLANGQIRYRMGHLERVLLQARDIALRGDFNVDNVMAAAAAACVLGADFETLREVVRDFKGLPHRLEFVREIRGVQFYNDSKATSVDAVSKALDAFEGGVHLILGGKDEGSSFDPLRSRLQGKVSAVYLIGAAAERLSRDLSGAAVLIRAGDLETAVCEAFGSARPGEVVLLAPACPSFDQFQDFEHRGRVFKEIVEKLVGELSEIGNGESGWGGRDPGFGAPSGGAGDAGQYPRSDPSSKFQSRDSAPESSPSLESRTSDPEKQYPDPEFSPPRPELVYLYEVGAEEYSPSEIDAAGSGAEKGEPGRKLRPPEHVEDEVLPFEVRAMESGRTQRTPNHSQNLGHTRPAGELVVKKAPEKESTDGGPRKRPNRQTRLPGF